ncbi:uncharacterized protein [Ptychodera flava]|uniref:uncharacterized protein n=1 Tax=Ptychodera flava TaxID=63121 RepID=UPI00396A9F7A
MERSALFITSWKRNSYGPANWKMITDFCENTLKKKPVEFSKIHCTVLDVDVAEEVKEDAARHSVTLIPATRPKLSDPIEDPPAINWIRFPDSYYPELGKLENINHVVALSSNVKKTAAALQESVFPGAKFHPPPDQPSAAVFINEAWNKDALGLTGFHRTLVQDFCERKAKAGETLKAYSTVLDVKISDDQKKDAENCGVTLIPAKRKEKADHRDDPPKLEWLLNHEIYYPDLREVENVQYVIGYAPKTGRAAADIRRKLFPGAKLVLINHARPETNCLQAEEHGLLEFEEKMLQMASEADILFSIGPCIYDYFENAYRAEVQGRDLSDIPHEEILPRPDKCFWEKKPREKPVTQHHILTCGQMDTQNAIEGCKSIAASIGIAANRRKEHYSSHPEWKIQGVSEKAGKTEQKILADASESPYVYPKLQSGHSAKSLLTSLQQSHLCLPSPCYWDYSFYGLEAMTFGLPTSVHDDSHLAHFVMKHLEMCVDFCVIRNCEVNLSKKIIKHLEKTPDSFKKAKAVKKALIDCEAITESFAKFASLLKEPIKQENEGDYKGQEVAECDDVRPSSDIGKSSTQSTRGVLESINRKMSTLPVAKDDGIGSQAVEETHGDVMAKDDAETGQATTTLSEMENENPNTEEAKVGNCDEEQQDFPVKVALDEEMLQKCIRQLEEQAKALSVHLRRLQERKKKEVKAVWRECEHRLKRRVQAVLADEDSCSEVKKVCKEKVGLDPNTLATGCLGILLKIVTLYYLYRLKQTCRSRNLAKALEPLLITDEMREIAAKVGITLQLKATYDTVKFKEIERFFINRDGGGIQPLTFHYEKEEDGQFNVDSKVRENISWDEEPSLSQQANKQVVVTASDQVAEQISQTNLGQEFEGKLIAQHGEVTQTITVSAKESQTRSLLQIKPSKQQLTDSDIRYLASAESKVQSLQSEPDTAQSKVNISESKFESNLQSQLEKAWTEKQILETKLAEAVQEKSQLEKQCQVYMQRCHSAEKVVSTQLSDINTLTAKLEKLDPKNIEDLQTKLEEQNKVITELKAKLSQLSDAQSDIEPQKKIAEGVQLGEQIIPSEIVRNEVSEPSADNVYIKPKITEIEEERPKAETTCRDGSEMETATPTQPEMIVREGSEMETATPTQPEMSLREGCEMETATPTQPEMTMTVREESEMETATPTQPEVTAREGSEMETATPTQPEMNVREGSEMETATSTQHEKTVRDESEMGTATPTQPAMTVREGGEMETATPTQHEKTVRNGSQMETATPTQPEMTVREGSEMETATLTQHEKAVREGSKMETATSTQPEKSAREGCEMETATPTQPEKTVREGSELEKDTPTQPEMTVREGSEMETATSTQPEMTVREGIEMETATLTQHEKAVREGSKMETATSTQPEKSAREGCEMETATPTQPEKTVREGSELEKDTPTQPEMTVREGSEMETATSTQPEMTVREGIEMETATSTQPEMTGRDESEIETLTATPTQPEIASKDGSEMETATTTQPEMTVLEGSEKETASPTQPEMTVREGTTPTQPEMTVREGSELEKATPTQPEMTVRERREMETATSTQSEMTVREGIEMETATSTQPEMTGRDGSEMGTATPTQPEMSGGDRSEMETATPTQPEMTVRR